MPPSRYTARRGYEIVPDKSRSTLDRSQTYARLPQNRRHVRHAFARYLMSSQALSGLFRPPPPGAQPASRPAPQSERGGTVGFWETGGQTFCVTAPSCAGTPMGTATANTAATQRLASGMGCRMVE